MCWIRRLGVSLPSTPVVALGRMEQIAWNFRLRGSPPDKPSLGCWNSLVKACNLAKEGITPQNFFLEPERRWRQPVDWSA